MRPIVEVSVSKRASSWGSSLRYHCMQVHISQAGSQGSLICSSVASVLCPVLPHQWGSSETWVKLTKVGLLLGQDGRRHKHPADRFAPQIKAILEGFVGSGLKRHQTLDCSYSNSFPFEQPFSYWFLQLSGDGISLLWKERSSSVRVEPTE